MRKAKPGQGNSQPVERTAADYFLNHAESLSTVWVKIQHNI
jgi:hypothetical protein